MAYLNLTDKQLELLYDDDRKPYTKAETKKFIKLFKSVLDIKDVKRKKK